MQKKCLHLEQQLEQASQNDEHQVEKQLGKLNQQLTQKTLEGDLKEQTIEELKKDLLYLKNKMELYSNEVELLSHQIQKTEEEKNRKIEELQVLLAEATAEKLTKSALPMGDCGFNRFNFSILIMVQYNYRD